jgi:hypothetical protein
MATALIHPQPYNPRVIAVTRDLIALAGDGNAAIFLAQVLFWWKVKGRQKFYKFNSPCDHALYRPGDSWLEEVCLRRTMFATARRRVAVKVRISCHDEIQAAFAEGALVVYGTDENHLTWYLVNEAALQTRSPALYARLFGTEPSAAPGSHPPRPRQRATPADSSQQHLPSPPVPQPTVFVAAREALPTSPMVISQCPTPLSASAQPLHSPMQTSCIGLHTEITTQIAPETASEINLQKQLPSTDTPLPTPGALATGEGGEGYRSERQKIAFAIVTGLQKRGVRQDPARLIARRAVHAGWGVDMTFETFDAHELDAAQTGARSPLGVAVSRMLDGTRSTPAPAWALARVRRRQQEQAWAERCDGVDALKQTDASDLVEGERQRVEPSPLNTLWDRVLGDIKLQVTRATFEQRFRHTWLEQCGDAYVVCARDPHTVEWLQHRLNRMITQTLQRWGGSGIQPHFACG